MDIITVLQILIGVIVFIMFLLILAYLYLIKPKKEKSDEQQNIYVSSQEEIKKEAKKIENYGRFQGELTQESIMQFMEFDEIVDNMIVRKNKTQYIMVLQCNGVNYDLMSEAEKLSVEQGFVQFLNTLRAPIQLYIQSRTLNLREIVDGYKDRVKTLKEDIEKIRIKLDQARRGNNRPLQEKLEFELRRKQSVLEYGIDITNYIERLNSNQNILQQKTYVIVSYFVSELGENVENYTKEEVNNMCFSELYTRTQNIASSLGASQVSSKILSSEELIELLYIAYNRDESEVYRLSQALDAQYDALYSTGKDVLQKKEEALDKEINIAAIDLATDSILRADKQKQVEDLEREREKTKKIKEKAGDLLGQYKNQLNPRVYEIAKENIEKGYDEEEKKVEKSTNQNKITKRKVQSKSAAKVAAQSENGELKTTAPRKKVVKKKIED